MRPSWILAVTLFAPLVAQTPPAKGADQPAAKATDASATKQSPIERLRAADEAGRGPAMIKFIDAQLDTNAIYSGQYAELGKLGWDVVPMLRKWLAEAPAEALAEGPNFRQACLNALRDCVAKPSDDLITELEALAVAPATPERVAITAKYALAQFGKTEHVDAMIEKATKGTTATDAQTKIEAWNELADIYYHIRRYEDAAKAHGEVITGITALNPNFQGLPATYYNCACAYALLGNKKAALEHLTKGLEMGKRINRQLELAMVQTDMDLRSLRSEPEFAALMKDYFGIEPPKAKAGAEPVKKAPGK